MQQSPSLQQAPPAVKPVVRGRSLTLLIAGLLVATIWLPRGLSLDRLVTPDEPSWLTNSANFYHALAHGEWENTYQIEHPGVTVMWLGTLGYLWRYPSYADEAPGQFVWWREQVGPFLEAQGYDPLEILKGSRVFVVLTITVILAATFSVAVRLLGLWPALLGLLFVAADPFHVAHSRLLHLDGLASSLMLLSLLALLTYLYRGRKHLDLALSGTAAGLAWLTKSPTLFLIPFCGLLLVLELWQSRQAGRWHRLNLRWAVRAYAIWTLVGGAVFILLWPAMWVDPIYTLRRVLRAAVGYAAGGHEVQLFFKGAIVYGDPGIAFYPITFLWRTTPIVLLGLILLLILHLSRARALAAAPWPILGRLALFTLLFTLFMSLGAKKFDRYLLPVFPPLDLLAAVGWVSAGRWLLRSDRHRLLLRAAVPVTLLMAVAGQFGGTLTTFPYYLSYYNPLLGGTVAAQEVMMVGWGEGLDQAAEQLSKGLGPPPSVMIGVWTGSFSYFYDGEIRATDFSPGPQTIDHWTSADYCVIYINQWQRGRLPQGLLDALEGLAPVSVVRLQNLDYVYVYDIRDVPAPPYLFSREASRVEGGP